MRQVADYLSLLAGEHRNKPKFAATVALLTAPLAAMQQFLADLPGQFDLDLAIGAQLDIDGLWIGRSRQIEVPLQNVFFSFDTPQLGFDQGVWFGPFTASEGLVSFDDTTYRALLRAKIIANGWDGTVAQAQAALQLILNPYPGTILGIVDNYNMSMDIGLAGLYPPPLIYYLVTGNYVPFKPEGVALNTYVTSVQGTPLFGLDVETGFIAGLDVGAWGVDPSEVSLQPNNYSINPAAISGNGAVSTNASIVKGGSYHLVGTASVVSGSKVSVLATASAAISSSGLLVGGTNAQGNLGGSAAGTGGVRVNATTLHFAQVSINGAGTFTPTATGRGTVGAVAHLVGSGKATYVVTESPTGTQSIQPGQLILASQTAGSAAPVNGPFDTWEITSGGQISHNGVVDTTTAGVTAVVYIGHTIYQMSSFGSGVTTPGWWSWSGTIWNAVVPPVGESSEGTFAVYTIGWN